MKASAGFLSFGGTLSGEVKKTLQQTLETSSVAFQLYARGGAGVQNLSGSIANLTDLEHVKQSVGDYLSTINSETAVPVEYVSQTMTQFGFRPDASMVLDPVTGLSDAYFQYRDSEVTAERLDEILSHRTTKYDYLTSDQIATYENDLEAHKNFMAALKIAVKRSLQLKEPLALPENRPPLFFGHLFA